MDLQYPEGERMEGDYEGGQDGVVQLGRNSW